MRRRLAIFSVDEPMFSVPGALPEDDALYEVDQGLLSGDDGGYTDFDELQREERHRARTQTGVYTLLGDDDGVSTDFLLDDVATELVPFPKDQSKSTPKRPRRTGSIMLLGEMEIFVRKLRIMCEPHRDAAQEESAQKKAVRKNIHRKAVSAKSVVEELKEMEYKARIGKFERVEECISAVSACIRNQDETFAEVLTMIDDHADKLREQHRKHRERKDVMASVRILTTGILGGDIPTVNFEQDADSDLRVSDQDSLRHTARISCSEAELSCWPDEALNDPEEMMVTVPKLPRPPIFNELSKGLSSDQKLGDPESADNLISLLGPDNPVMKNVISLKRLRKLRSEALAKADRARRTMNGKLSNPVSKLTNGSVNANNTSISAITEEVGLPVLRSPAASSVVKDAAPLSSFSANVADQPDFHITNDAAEFTSSKFGGNSETRERALIRAISALLCMHDGFTHCSYFALEILADVVEDFIQRIGRSLVSCRENIDSGMVPRESNDRPRSKTEEEFLEEVRLVCFSGFRGGFDGLNCYVRADISRTEQAIREAELKIRNDMDRLREKENPETILASVLAPLPASNAIVRQEMKGSAIVTANRDAREVEAKTKEADVELVLDDCARIFGHMKDGVSIDVLGRWKVPRKLALSNVHETKNSSLNLNGNLEKTKRTARVKSEDIALADVMET